VRCLVAYLTWWALLLFVLAVSGVSDVTGQVGLVGFGWFGYYAPLLLRLPDRSALQLVPPMGLLGSFILGTPCFS